MKWLNPKPPFPEHDMAAVSIPLLAVTDQDTTKSACFHQTFLLTSSSDKVGSMCISTPFATRLRLAGIPKRLHVYHYVRDNGFFTQWFDENNCTQTDMSDFLDLPSTGELSRVNCIGIIHSAHIASLLLPLKRSRTSAANIREVLRCLESNIWTDMKTSQTLPWTILTSNWISRLV